MYDFVIQLKNADYIYYKGVIILMLRRCDLLKMKMQ